MKLRFVNKSFMVSRNYHLPVSTPVVNEEETVVEEKPVVSEEPKKAVNKRTKKSKTMKADEQIMAAETVLNDYMPQEVKVVKKDRGLIERTESSKIILTEDNRQVLND